MYCNISIIILLTTINWVSFVHVPEVTHIVLKGELYQVISASGASLPLLVILVLQQVAFCAVWLKSHSL